MHNVLEAWRVLFDGGLSTSQILPSSSTAFPQKVPAICTPSPQVKSCESIIEYTWNTRRIHVECDLPLADLSLSKPPLCDDHSEVPTPIWAGICSLFGSCLYSPLSDTDTLHPVKLAALNLYSCWPGSDGKLVCSDVTVSGHKNGLTIGSTVAQKYNRLTLEEFSSPLHISLVYCIQKCTEHFLLIRYDSPSALAAFSHFSSTLTDFSPTLAKSLFSTRMYLSKHRHS